MPKISAIIHAENDGRRIGRALESLRACDQVLVVDHGSNDETSKIAREHGASVRIGIPGVEPGAYVMDAHHDWILCLLPTESLSEGLEASLFEWKDSDPSDAVVGYCVDVRGEANGAWQSLGSHLRLVNRKRMNWPDRLPPDNGANVGRLEGEVMRFATP